MDDPWIHFDRLSYLYEHDLVNATSTINNPMTELNNNGVPFSRFPSHQHNQFPAPQTSIHRDLPTAGWTNNQTVGSSFYSHNHLNQVQFQPNSFASFLSPPISAQTLPNAGSLAQTPPTNPNSGHSNSEANHHHWHTQGVGYRDQIATRNTSRFQPNLFSSGDGVSEFGHGTGMGATNSNIEPYFSPYQQPSPTWNGDRWGRPETSWSISSHFHGGAMNGAYYREENVFSSTTYGSAASQSTNIGQQVQHSMNESATTAGQSDSGIAALREIEAHIRDENSNGDYSAAVPLAEQALAQDEFVPEEDYSDTSSVLAEQSPVHFEDGAVEEYYDEDDENMNGIDVNEFTNEEVLALRTLVRNMIPRATIEPKIEANLRRQRFHFVRNEASEENEMCCVCQEDYNDGDGMGMLDCSHYSHFKCIKQWLGVSNTCPLCKSTGLSFIGGMS